MVSQKDAVYKALPLMCVTFAVKTRKPFIFQILPTRKRYFVKIFCNNLRGKLLVLSPAVTALALPHLTVV